MPDELAIAFLARQMEREGADPARAVRMAGEFVGGMRSLEASARVAAEETEGLRISLVALSPNGELREYEEWVRSHPVRRALARLDARVDDILVAVGAALLRLLRRTGIMREP